MTSIVIATRDGILTAPSGEKFRMVRGKTLADARHPAVAAYPDNWMPVEVDISVDDPEQADPGQLEDDFATELAEATAEAEEYRAQLVAITDVLMSRGMVPAGTDTDKPGWLAEAVTVALDTLIHAPHDSGSEPDDVPPPPAPRKRTARP